MNKENCALKLVDEIILPHSVPSSSLDQDKFGFFFSGATQLIVDVYFTALYRDLASSLTRLLDHKQRRATVGRTPLNE